MPMEKKTVMEGLRINFLSPVTRPAQEGAIALLMKRADSPQDYLNRKLTEDQLSKLTESGVVLPDGQFPIETKSDLVNAIKVFDRSKHAALVVSHIQKRAEALDLVSLLPDAGPLAVLRKDESPGVVTSVVEGHAHVIWLYGTVGETTFQQSGEEDDDGSYHDHPWRLLPDGSIEVVFNDGHTHEVAAADLQFSLLAMRKDNGEARQTFTWPGSGQIDKGNDMPAPKKTEKTAEELQADVTQLTDRLELQGILAGMTDAEKTYFSTLGATEKAEFATATPEDRAEDIAELKKQADASDPVVYTSTDGDEFRKSDDPRMVRSARKADKAEKRADAAELAAADSGFTKRADSELSHLPGTTTQRAALLKAIAGIDDDDDRKAAGEALKASDKALSRSFNANGTSEGAGVEDVDGAEAKLDVLVKDHMAKNAGDTEAASFVKVLETEEGKALYGEMAQQ